MYEGEKKKTTKRVMLLETVFSYDRSEQLMNLKFLMIELINY